MSVETNKTSAFEGALRWVGDLDHPFYSDERQRFIWYEASAIGFQLILLLQFFVSGLGMLIFGKEAAWYMVAAMVPTALTSCVVMFYTHRRGAAFFVQSSDLKRSRGIVGMGVVWLWAAGMVRVYSEMPDSSGQTGIDVRIITSLVVGLLVGVGMSLWTKRKNRLDEEAAANTEV